MAKNLFIVALIIVGLGCKKSFDDDTIRYKWKRDLYRARVQNEGPAVFYSSDPRVGSNPDAIFVTSDYIVLTEFCKNQQQDGIYKASARVLVYKYDKVDK